MGTRGELHKPRGPRAVPNHEGHVPATGAVAGEFGKAHNHRRITGLKQFHKQVELPRVRINSIAVACVGRACQGLAIIANNNLVAWAWAV
jgi:hypothetical protein